MDAVVGCRLMLFGKSAAAHGVLMDDLQGKSAFADETGRHWCLPSKKSFINCLPAKDGI